VTYKKYNNAKKLAAEEIIATRPPNSHECTYFGRKLSCIICNDIEIPQNHIETSNETYVHIGSDRDDEIYWDDNNLEAGPTLKERVVINCINDDDENNGKNCYSFDIDLEDALRFAAKYCRGIYERVLGETEESK
jgi:hypothetical protein